MATAETIEQLAVTSENAFADEAAIAVAVSSILEPEYDPSAPQVAAATAAAVASLSEKRWPGWPGDCVFRLIVPVVKVGSIIGRKGELIKKMCEETRARIRVLDGSVGTPDRIVSLLYVFLYLFMF